MQNLKDLNDKAYDSRVDKNLNKDLTKAKNSAACLGQISHYLTQIRYEKWDDHDKDNLSAADVKMEIPVLVRSLKSSILSSTSFQMGKTFWGVASAAVEQSRRKANMVVQGDGKFDP